MPTVAGTITNTASVTANEIDPDSSNNTTIRAVTSVQEAQAQLPIVFLLLHGTASEPETWDVLVASRFAGVCPPTRMGEDVTERSLCYRLHFEPRIGWLNGDGSTFRRLGIEVGQAIEKIKNVMQPAAIVLVGHSRGGLAARAYVQGLVEPPPVALGLVTIGTPHQGTPLGRIKRWLADNGFSDLSRTGRAIARFFPREDRYRVKATLFSPSVGYQATAHKKNGKLACNLDDPRSVSYQICKLREGADVLDDWVSTFGQLYSIKLDLGENVAGGYAGHLDDILHHKSALGRVIPGSFRDMRKFVLENIGDIDEDGDWKCTESDRGSFNNWACNGDGIVPTISQRLTRLPGFAPGAIPLHTEAFIQTEIPHITETAQVAEIRTLLDNVANDLRQ